MLSLIVLMLYCLLIPCIAAAQVTWTPLNLPDPDDAARRILFRAVAHNGELIGVTRMKAWRVSAPPSFSVTEILCPGPTPADPPLRPEDVTGVNASGTVVGTALLTMGGQPRIGGLLQASDGTCEIVAPPAPLVNLFLTALNDLGESAGFTQGPDVARGLRRFEGVQRTPDGTLTPLSGVCDTDADGVVSDDTMYPDAMAGPWLVGHAHCRLQPNNHYTYEAFVCQDGVGCQLLRDPAGKTLWLTAVTPQGTAYGVQADEAGVSGGKGWLIDLPTLTFTDPPLPPPSTSGGIVESCAPDAASAHWFVCTALERTQPCPPPGLCLVTPQWLGQLPPPPPAPEPLEPAKKPRHERKPKDDRKEHQDRGKKGGPR